MFLRRLSLLCCMLVSSVYTCTVLLMRTHLFYEVTVFQDAGDAIASVGVCWASFPPVAHKLLAAAIKVLQGLCVLVCSVCVGAAHCSNSTWRVASCVLRRYASKVGASTSDDATLHLTGLRWIRKPRHCGDELV